MKAALLLAAVLLAGLAVCWKQRSAGQVAIAADPPARMLVVEDPASVNAAETIRELSKLLAEAEVREEGWKMQLAAAQALLRKCEEGN